MTTMTARPMPGKPARGEKPGILLDRDGTIIVDHGYVGSIDRVEFIDGAAEAIASFNRAGIPVAVVTNQAGVARGFTASTMSAKYTGISPSISPSTMAQFDLFLFCPYHPGWSRRGIRSRRATTASHGRGWRRPPPSLSVLT